MKLTRSIDARKWNQWLAKFENAWFYMRNPSLLLMTFERVEVRGSSRVENREDLYDYDLEA